MLIGIDDSSSEECIQKNEIAWLRQGLREGDALLSGVDDLAFKAVTRLYLDECEAAGPSLAERELNFSQTVRLVNLLSAPREMIVNLPAGWRARREKDTLRLLEPGNRTKNNRPKSGKKGRQDD